MKANKQKELKIREAEIIKRIRKGWSHSKITEWLSDNYGLSKSHSYNLVTKAFNTLAEKADEVIENAKNIQIERLEDMLVNSLESEDKKTALKALDMLNKIYGLYVQKQDINVNGENLTFKFAE